MTAYSKNNIWLIACCLVTIIAYINNNMAVKTILCAAIFYSGFILRFKQLTLVYLVLSLAVSTINTALLAYIVIAPIYFSEKIKLTFANLIYILIVAILGLLSFVFGIDPNINTFILFLLCQWLFLMVLNTEITVDDIYRYSVGIFATIAGILLFEFSQGNSIILYGRLALNGNIRELADLLSIPIFFSVSLLILQGTDYIKSLILLFVTLVSSFFLLATLSKGVIISTIFSIMIVFLLSKREKHLKLLLLGTFIILIFIVYIYTQSTGLFRMERLMEQDEGFSGRTAIWTTYFNHMEQRISTIFWGFGPGDIKRLEVSKYYSHSLFLDVFFSYGIMGACALWALLIRSFINILKTYNAFSLGMFALAILQYFTHGTATNPIFYILLGISCTNPKFTK